jgi:hypothetical protein
VVVDGDVLDCVDGDVLDCVDGDVLDCVYGVVDDGIVFTDNIDVAELPK